MKRQLFYALAAMAAFLPVSCASTSPFEKVGLNGSEVPYTVLAKTNDGVEIQNGGYGSDACAHPTDSTGLSMNPKNCQYLPRWHPFCIRSCLKKRGKRGTQI